MNAFVKSFANYRTTKQAAVLSSSLVLDSLDQELSSVTVLGTEITCSDAGNWLIVDGLVYLITQVKPMEGQTQLTLKPPLDAFQRPLELSQLPTGSTVGSFLAGVLHSGWIECRDLAYATPYLQVSVLDTPSYVPPDLDGSGCFTIPSYLRLMRKSYRILACFSDQGTGLQCVFSTYPLTSRQISFEDGRSQLQSLDFSSGGLAKLTALQDVDSGEKDADGNKILTRHRTEWYLAPDGSISTSVPEERASGEWGTIQVPGDQSVQEKVIEAFAKNMANHKLEFRSFLDLNIQDRCTVQLQGEAIQSYISYKRKDDVDNRFYYKSGELPTTAAEKLKGAIK